MGRRSTSTTKGGRAMNPADQARKMARKRELKKNKKQRTFVRQAILKSKDVDDIIDQMRKLDRMATKAKFASEFDPEHEPPLPERVIQEKRTKLRETYGRVLAMHKREGELEKFNALRKQMQSYDAERMQVQQNFMAVKFAKDNDPDEIPLPDGLALPGAEMTPQGGPPAGIPLPPPAFFSQMMGGFSDEASRPPPQSILKKRLEQPPGPPFGFPPELSDDSDDSDRSSEGPSDEDGPSKVREPSAKKERSKVRFDDGAGGDDDEEKDTRTMYKERAKRLAAGDEAAAAPPTYDYTPPIGAPIMGPPAFLSGQRLPRPPPPPPGMPPQMGARIPPPQQLSRPSRGTSIGPQIPTAPPPTNAAVIQAAPTILRRSEGASRPAVGGQQEKPASSSSATTIVAKPRLRNMQREATRFVPTAVKVGHAVGAPTAKKRGLAGGGAGLYAPSGAAQTEAQAEQASTADAYSRFMQEMEGLL